VGVVWVALLGVLCICIWLTPLICRNHFMNWQSNQRHVIDRLRDEGQWQEALIRAEHLIREQPYDPRPLLQRAEILAGQRRELNRDPHADPEVEEAYRQTVEGQFHTATYPMLLSSIWRRDMAEACHQWAQCLAQSGDWEGFAFALEYAAALDTDTADEIIERLTSQTENPDIVPQQVLAAHIRILQRRRGGEAALSELERLLPAIDANTAVTLLTEAMLSGADNRRRIDWMTLPGLSHDDPSLLLALSRQRWVQGVSDRSALDPHIPRVLRESEPLLDIEEVIETSDMINVISADNLVDVEIPLVNEAGDLLLLSSGELHLRWADPLPSPETAWLVLRGTPALGIWPIVEISVNGSPPRLFYIAGHQWLMLPLSIPGGEIESLRIRYLNDGGFPLLTEVSDGTVRLVRSLEDRNLVIKGLLIPAGQWATSPSSEEENPS
jgi:hypothetical protein